MSIVDSKVVTSYEADISGHKSQVELLRAHQQAFAAELMKGLEGQNKKLESTIAMWGKVAVGIGAVVSAIKIAKAGWEEFGKAQELADATHGVRIDGLRKASRGLKNDMELLEFAAKTNAGAFKLTNDQMQLAIKAMEVYEDRGHDAAKVTDVLTDALIKGDTKGLRSFGVQIHETGTKAEKFQAVIAALRKDVEEAGVQTDVGTDAWKRHGVTIENAMSRTKQALGEIVVALTPLVEKLAEAANWVAKIANSNEEKKSVADAQKLMAAQYEENTRGSSLYTAFKRAGIAQGKYGLDRLTQEERDQLQGVSINRVFHASRAQTSIESTQDALDTIIQAVALEAEKKRELAAKRGDTSTNVRRDAMLADREQIDALLAYNEAGAPRVTEGMGRLDSSRFGASLDKMFGVQGPSIEERYAAFSAGQHKSKMAEIFGPIEDFDLYAEAWNTLRGAVATAMDAWITGSMSVGKAVKMMLGEALRGYAIELAIKSMRETAEAIAMLANPYTAALAPGHFKAAAAYAAGAAAAGIGAKLLGAGGSTAVGGGAGAAPTGPAPATQATRTSTVIVAYGDDFADDSPRKRAQQARRLVERGLAENSAGGAY